MNKKYLNTEEASYYLSLGKSTVNALCSRGELPYSMPCRRRIFCTDDLDKWLNSYRVATKKELEFIADNKLNNFKNFSNDKV